MGLFSSDFRGSNEFRVSIRFYNIKDQSIVQLWVKFEHLTPNIQKTRSILLLPNFSSDSDPDADRKGQIPGHPDDADQVLGWRHPSWIPDPNPYGI